MDGPDFIVAGAARSGSTTLWSWLRAHPQVFMTEPKEPTFFVADRGSLSVASREAYAALFRDAGDRLKGEASAGYLHDEASAQLLHDDLGDIKVLVVLRDPVKRAFSAHCLMVEWGWEPIIDFEAALAAEPERVASPAARPQLGQMLSDYAYVRSSTYAPQLRRFTDRFTDVKVLLLEDLVQAPQPTFDDVCAWLGVPPSPLRDSGATNQSRCPRWPRLQHVLASSMPAGKPAPVRRRVQRLNRRLGRPARLDPAIEARLRAGFVDDVRETAALIDRDLSGWLPQGVALRR